MGSCKWGSKSPNNLIGVITLVTLLITPLITTHELPSKVFRALGSNVQDVGLMSRISGSPHLHKGYQVTPPNLEKSLKPQAPNHTTSPEPSTKSPIAGGSSVDHQGKQVTLITCRNMSG